MYTTRWTSRSAHSSIHLRPMSLATRFLRTASSVSPGTPITSGSTARRPSLITSLIRPSFIRLVPDGDHIGVDGAQDNLGQLRREQGNEVTTSAQAEGAIEGKMEDYLMDDAFATHFEYSRWDVAAAAPRNVSALTGVKKLASMVNPGFSSTAGTAGDDMILSDGESAVHQRC